MSGSCEGQYYKPMAPRNNMKDSVFCGIYKESEMASTSYTYKELNSPQQAYETIICLVDIYVFKPVFFIFHSGMG